MDEVKTNLKNAISELISEYSKDSEIELEVPKESQFGDFSTNIALKLSKTIGKNPLEIATSLALKLSEKKISGVDRVEAVKPGFINFYISGSIFKEVLKGIDSNFGKSDWGKNQHWLIEHTSSNPNKAMHFGHLRNNVTGMAISNLWEAIGVKVTRDYIDNDRGIALAKLMWGYLKFAKKDESIPTDINYWYENQDKWKTPSDLSQKPDQFVDKLYTLASEDFKDPEVEKIVRKFVIDWENEDPINWALWKLVLGYSHEGQKETLDRLGSKTDKFWHEHEIYKKGKEIVEEGLEKNVFVRLEDGAVLTNLKEYKIPDTVVIKRDGTSLYITQDLALTKLKRDTFNPDKLFWVIGPDQSLALKQVFAVCEQMGFGKIEDYTHISFGYVTIKGQGKMSSRKGNVVYIDDLLDDARDVISEKISNEELSEEEKKEVAEKLGVGAVKYSILKVGRLTDTAFDFNTSLSFEGDSAPYLVYTYTRCRSILNQAGNFEIGDHSDLLNNEVEIRLIKHLSKFPDVVLNASLTYSPNLVASYLYELAQAYNSFYSNLSVLNAENEMIKNARLLLTASVAQVLKNGLNLLGIETVERM